MTTHALQHFLEHAIDVHAATLEQSFPLCFDWERLCRDTPALVETSTEGRFDTTDRVQAEALAERAQVVFRLAHAVSLGVFCAADEAAKDPEGDLERFARFPEEEEEERFETLVVDVLGPAEEFLFDPEVELDERGVEAYRLHALAWPHVEEMLAAASILDASPEGDVPPAPDEARPVLYSLARVATLLAALRWMAR